MIIKNYIRENKIGLLSIIVYTFLATSFISLIPICTKLVIDNYRSLNKDKLIYYSLTYVLAIVLFLFFEYMKKISLAKYSKNYSIYIKDKIFSSITRMEKTKLNQKSSGVIINTIINDTEVIYENYIYTRISLYISLISFIIYLVYMFYLNWILSLVVIASSIISFFIPKIVGKKMSGKRKDFSDKSAKLIEELESLLETKEFFNDQASPFLNRKFQDANRTNEESGFDLSKYIAFTNIFSGASLYFINIFTFVAGIILVSLNMIELGEFIGIIAFIDLVALPIRDMIYLIITIRSSSDIISKLDFYLNDFVETRDKESIKDFNKIEIINLDYKIKNFHISNINMEFEKGKKYIIIGDNGSGKSTIMKILAGYYKTPENQIFIDGIDLVNLNIEDLIIYLSNPFTIDASTYDNISLANPNQPPKQEAIRLVENIKNTDVNSLSMGERARLNIARAINSYHPIIILDEFFSNVDSFSEIAITKELMDLDKTIILVSHNTSKDYIELFDKVYRISKI